MPANGFIGFITSQGFFIGLIFGTLKSDDPFDILFMTLAVTSIFYMFAQISVSYFVRFIDIRSSKFANNEHETVLDYFAIELEKREDIYERGVYDKPKKKKTKAGVANAA